MADEKNQNDEVQDLLARLRSQMSQLDKMFGIDPQPTSSDEAEPTAVSEQTSLEDTPCAGEHDAADFEDVPQAESDDVEPAEKIEDTAEDASKENEEALTPEKDATAESMTQIDFFEALDEVIEQEACAADEGAGEKTEPPSEIVDGENDADDDVLVFSKTDLPLRIRKESIVAQELLTEEKPSEAVVVVTEGERPFEAPREQTETHASVFVPNTTPTEDEKSGTTLSPFSTERRFDPSKYDAMLEAYEKRKAEALKVNEQPEAEEHKAPDMPQTPVLMPVTPIFVPVEKNAEEPVEEPTEEPAEEPTEELAEELIEELAEELIEEPAEEPAEELAEELIEEPAEEPVEELIEEPVEEPAEEPVEEPVEDPVEEPAAEPLPPASARVVLARADLSDTDRDLHSRISSGRVHLAPSAYRAKDGKSQGKSRDLPEEDEEDFMEGLPSGIRESLIGFPLGRPNRAQNAKTDEHSIHKPHKKRKIYRFPEEIEGKRDEEASSDYVRHHLKETLRQTRARLIVIAVLAFMLLLLENITLAKGFVPEGFVDVKTAGIIDAILLVGIAIAAWPRLSVGVKGLFHGRVLPETILFVQLQMALIYATVFGILKMPTMYFSFVPALGIAVLYSFCVLRYETEQNAFEKINSAGEKLILSPTAKKDMLAEMNALGKNLDGETPLIYRIRKTSFVKSFSERSSTVCEDERLNFGILLSSLFIGAACFLIAFFIGGYAPEISVRAALFGCFLSSPLAMVGVHTYAMYRADRVAGEDSALAGEATVKEAVCTEAIAFEDIEAAPSSGVVLSGIRVHCDDPSAVFKYLTALYGYIGGPLCGCFSGMYTNKSVTTAALVELVDATKDGISAAIDGAEIVVGNGNYMVSNGITPTFDAEDERVLSDGKSGVLYVAINGMVCMKFYMEHRISTAFEKNVLRLHRLGIATILRTYDPNFNDKTLSRASTLADLRVHVVAKTVEQRNDFYAERAVGGIVTADSSGKLLRLLFLCFRVRRQLRFGWVYKLIGTILGAAASIALCVLGFFSFVPSVYLALYHLVFLAFYMAITAIGVKLPEISKGK